tara:strand:- start:8760 stop:10343 length:1584 start_codon:yes stop_codon:yes gene_type:complete
MGTILSIYGSHDSSVTFIGKDGKIRVLEYERFVKQRYAAFTSNFEHISGLGTTNEQRVTFLNYIKDNIDGDVDKILHNELSSKDIAQVTKNFPKASLTLMEHHRSHAASGFYQSNFEKALIFSIDGGGYDNNTVVYTKAFLGDGTTISDLMNFGELNAGVPYATIGCPISEIKPGPDGNESSLVYAGKVMGLCAYGNVRDEWLTPMREFYSGNGSIQNLGIMGVKIGMDLSFNSLQGQDSYDLAATSQHIFEEMLLERLLPLLEQNGYPDVVLVGGCALNVLFNQRLSKIMKEHGKNVYIPPNPNDCGLSLGQFLLESPQYVGNITYNGFDILDIDDLPNYIDEREAEKVTISKIVDLLKEGNIIGMVNGGSEIGPRALGNRSIICDPSFPKMKDTLNAKVKFREWYRPFAPVCRLEDSNEYFDDVFESSCMTLAPKVNEKYRKQLISVTHKDGTARLQTVKKGGHENFYDILTELKNRGEIPVILNTSFNIKGNPILTTIVDALHVLDNTEMDYVIIDGYIFSKND